MEKNNIKLRYYSGSNYSEYDSNIEILVDIIGQFSRVASRDTDFFYIDVYRNNDLPIYELNNETIDFNGYHKIRGQHKGIKLSFNGSDLIYSDLLKVLYFGLTNQQYIDGLQKASLNDSVYWYPFVLKPLINARLKQVIAEDNPLVTTVLQKRYYRVLTHHRERRDSVDYYYQKGQFHVYKTKKEVQSNVDTGGKALGSFDKIQFILSDTQNHYLIFVNRFSFYHLILNEEKLSGPYYSPESLTPRFFENTLKVEKSKIRIYDEYYKGDFIFDYTNGAVRFDSSSIHPDYLEGIRQARNYKIQRFVDRVMSVRDLRSRRYNGVIIIIVTILVNIYLARYKK